MKYIIISPIIICYILNDWDQVSSLQPSQLLYHITWDITAPIKTQSNKTLTSIHNSMKVFSKRFWILCRYYKTLPRESGMVASNITISRRMTIWDLEVTQAVFERGEREIEKNGFGDAMSMEKSLMCVEIRVGCIEHNPHTSVVACSYDVAWYVCSSEKGAYMCCSQCCEEFMVFK